MRVGYSRQFLPGNDLPVTPVASNSGYHNIDVFRIAFK
jgi:transcriptional regulator GlxA family with amidase domain